MIQFDPGYHVEPFRSLCESYPDEVVYPQKHFRVEWGPVFHRGRLDGTARILILGQDPAQHENIVRRILVGEAGQRIQGFLAKLGINRGYVMINTFLYSVYGGAPAKVRRDPALVAYRNQWIDALLSGARIQAVVTLGTLAEEAWNLWKATSPRRQAEVPSVKITHPTQPESSSKGDKEKLREATRKMLDGWNAAIGTLRQVLTSTDFQPPAKLYGEVFTEGDRLPVPDCDIPAGIPCWMRVHDGWARRAGTTDAAKRASITLKVPAAVMRDQENRR